MRRKFIVITFVLVFLAFVSNEMRGQSDGYFTTVNEYRSLDAPDLSFYEYSRQIGNGFNFETFMSDGNGYKFEAFIDEAPITNGLLLLTSVGLIYLMNKRRKENE